MKPVMRHFRGKKEVGELGHSAALDKGLSLLMRYQIVLHAMHYENWCCYIFDHFSVIKSFCDERSQKATNNSGCCKLQWLEGRHQDTEAGVTHLGQVCSDTTANGSTKDEDVLLSHSEYIHSVVEDSQRVPQHNVWVCLFITKETISWVLHRQNSDIESSFKAAQEEVASAKIFGVPVKVKQQLAGTLLRLISLNLSEMLVRFRSE